MNGVLENESIAVRSVLTAALVTEGTSTGTIACQGSVTLKKITAAPVERRNLQGVSPSSEAVVVGGGDDDDESVETPFKMNIYFDTPKKNINSSVPLTSSITTVVSVFGFGSVLSFIVSLFL